MRAKPEMEPWVYTDKSRVSSVGAALIERAFGLCRCGSWLCIRWGSAAPTELKNVVATITPGLVPWAMKKCRPFAGPFYLHYAIIYIYYFMRLALACSQVEAYRVSGYSYLCKDLILGML